MANMSERTRTRGRPRIGDPDVISGVALELMATQGWSATTMQDIANAVGISAPTLFRYFPTKADALWHRMDQTAEEFRTFFHCRPASSNVADTLAESYLEMLLSDPERLRIVKRRIAIMASDLDASQASWPKFEEWRLLITRMIAEVRGLPDDALSIKVVGAMTWSALWQALSAWALSADDDPTTYVCTAHHYMLAANQ